MNIDETFLTQLAAEIARLRFEVGAILTAVAPLGVNPEAIRLATDIAAESPAFQEIVQDIVQRLRGPQP